LAQITSWKDN